MEKCQCYDYYHNYGHDDYDHNDIDDDDNALKILKAGQVEMEKCQRYQKENDSAAVLRR